MKYRYLFIMGLSVVTLLTSCSSPIENNATTSTGTARLSGQFSPDLVVSNLRLVAIDNRQPGDSFITFSYRVSSVGRYDIAPGIDILLQPSLSFLWGRLNLDPITIPHYYLDGTIGRRFFQWKDTRDARIRINKNVLVAQPVLNLEVNPDSAVYEGDHSNNTASILIESLPAPTPTPGPTPKP